MMHPRGAWVAITTTISPSTRTTRVIIADVAGKGVPAALLMSATAATMRRGPA